MVLSTFIKLIFLLTILFGNIILSVTSKILTSSRNHCRCGHINLPHKITGGKFTKPHAYPWQAYILMYYANGSLATACGGTVINNMYILSAAHCGHKIEGEIEVHLGLHQTSFTSYKQTQYFKVEKKIIHENFEEKTKNDIAILKVNKRIKFNKYVKPICLQNQYEQFEGKRATVIGWGNTKVNGSMSDILKEATLQVLERKKCEEILIRLEYDYTMFCAYGGINGQCQGDSGGPLFYTNENGKAVQIGIVSFSYGCGEEPGIFTKISTFLDWIHKNTKDATYCKRKM